jgi:hypothetical protein
MKKIRNINISNELLNKNIRSYPKPYPALHGSLNVLYPEPMVYGGKNSEINVMIIE